MNLNDLHRLREKFLSEKKFLAELYSASCENQKRDVRHFIMYATSPQLQVLVIILHKIATKKITVAKKFKQRLVRSKKQSFLDQVKSATDVQQMLTLPRADITSFLCKFVPLYAAFLHYLFHT